MQPDHSQTGARRNAALPALNAGQVHTTHKAHKATETYQPLKPQQRAQANNTKQTTKAIATAFKQYDDVHLGKVHNEACSYAASCFKQEG